MYAITLGTNSFSIPMEAPMAPSLNVFYRSGLYEMMAGVLIAVSPFIDNIEGYVYFKKE